MVKKVTAESIVLTMTKENVTVQSDNPLAGGLAAKVADKMKGATFMVIIEGCV